MIKDAYEKLKRKYNLPEFEKINSEFEISTLEHEEFLLANIRKKMYEKLMFFADALEPTVQPTETVANVYEIGRISQNDRKSAIEIYKMIMYWARAATEATAYADEKKDAEFIKELFIQWPDIKKGLISIFSKLKEVWKKNEGSSEENGYFL